MASDESPAKPHAVCLPFPAQSHISAMLKLAKLLHWKGLRITFVNTEFNHRRMVRARGGPGFLDSLPDDFRFTTIPDGLPPSDANATQDVGALLESCRNLIRAPFVDLVECLIKRAEVEPSFPAVSCIVSDFVMTYSTIPAGEKFGLPVVNFCPVSASTVMCFMIYPELLGKGFTPPLKDVDGPSNGYLESIIDWVPSMKNMRLRDFPTFIRNTQIDEMSFHLIIDAIEIGVRAVASVIHTYEALEQDILNALSSMLTGPVYGIGPLSLLLEQIPDEVNQTRNIYCNLWEEDTECLRWLDQQEPGSVLYINFGSVAFLTLEQATEFAMGIANCGHPFLWIIRPDLVNGETTILPKEFAEKTKGRGYTTEWCPQEEVLKHPSVGGFLTHCGWNSTIESMSAGIPMLCWPSFADQQTNCRLVCAGWEIGLEIKNDVKRDEVEKLVRELMDGGKGKKMKDRAAEWKKSAKEAIDLCESSSRDLDKLVSEILSK